MHSWKNDTQYKNMFLRAVLNWFSHYSHFGQIKLHIDGLNNDLRAH